MSSKSTIRVRPRVADENRKRASQACWRCRERKSRCILARSEKNSRQICQRCEKSGLLCEFSKISSEKGAALPVEQHNILEARSQIRFPRPPTSYASSVSALTPQSPDDVTSLSGNSIAKGASKRVNEDPRLLVKNPRQTHYIGEVSNGSFLSQVQGAVIADSPVDVENEIPSEYSQSLDSSGADADLIKRALQAFPPKTVSDFLVSTFIHSVEANYYYMNREQFKERLDKYYSNSTQESSEIDASFICLALMVFSMGSQFADLRAPSKPATSLSSSKHGPGMVFYTKAKSLLPDVITQCALEGIQACFLMALFTLPSNTSDLSYVYHGMAMKMAIANGLHRKIPESSLESLVLEVRNRLWWSLYTSERRLSIILDRPESIHEDDIDTPFPVAREELDLAPAEDNIANLQASIELTKIFNKVVKLGKSVDFARLEAEASFAQLKQDLDSWLTKIPPKLQLSNLNPEGKTFRGTVHLHMAYSQITIYMGRSSLLRLVQTRLRRLRTTEAGNEEPLPSLAEENLTRACVAAAYRVVDLIKYLSDNQKLARYSFTDLNCCSSAAVIIIIHELIVAHPLYNSTISSILRFMKFMASGCQNAKHGFKFIQNLLILVEAVRKSPPPQLEACRADPNLREEYKQWESWMAEAERNNEEHGQTGSRQPQNDNTVDDWQIDSGLGQANILSASDGPPLENIFSAAVLPYSEDSYDNFELHTGMQYPFMSNWPDELNSLLGLDGFEGLQFPNM